MSFYASTDTQITQIGLLSSGRSTIALSTNSWTVVTLHCTLPTNIPAGTYYVGWIIDPENINDEINEDNNTAFKDSPLLTVSGTSQPVLYVDIDARGADDGSSWENAFHSLQDALAVAAKGSEIRVADGVYRPDRGTRVKRGDRRATFELKSGVAIVGGYAGAGEPNPNARNVETQPDHPQRRPGRRRPAGHRSLRVVARAVEAGQQPPRSDRRRCRSHDDSGRRAQSRAAAPMDGSTRRRRRAILREPACTSPGAVPASSGACSRGTGRPPRAGLST